MMLRNISVLKVGDVVRWKLGQIRMTVVEPLDSGGFVSCGKPYITEVEKDNYYMGNTIYTTRCGGCQQVNKVMVV